MQITAQPNSNKTVLLQNICLVLALILLTSGAALSFINHDFFVNQFVVEDGPIEWFTVFILICAAVLCARRFYLSFKRDKKKSYQTVLFILTLFFCFGAGEEISWGQRLLNIESSEFFMQNNAQNETNFHNLVVADVKLNKLIFGTGFALILLIYLLIFTPLYRLRPATRNFFDALAIPIARNIHIFAFFILLFVVELIMQSPKRGEITECVGALVVFATLLNPINWQNFN